MNPARRISPAALEDFARRILDDERWEVLREQFLEEMFHHWCSELDKARRDQIHQEYLGFSLFCSKLNMLAHKPKLGDQK